jgi:hypothetical protein
MGQVKKEHLKDHWLTDPAVKTPDFAKLMSRCRVQPIWQYWYFIDNTKAEDSADRLFKITRSSGKN